MRITTASLSIIRNDPDFIPNGRNLSRSFLSDRDLQFRAWVRKACRLKSTQFDAKWVNMNWLTRQTELSPKQIKDIVSPSWTRRTIVAVRTVMDNHANKLKGNHTLPMQLLIWDCRTWKDLKVVIHFVCVSSGSLQSKRILAQVW